MNNFKETEEADHWWESGPVFSTTDKRADTITLAPGQPVGRFTLGTAIDIVWLALVWAALIYLGFARMFEHEVVPSIAKMAHSWWWITLIVVFVILMVISSFGVFDDADRSFTKGSVAFGFVFNAASAGIFIAGLLHFLSVNSYVQSLPEWSAETRFLHPMIMLVITVVALTCFVISLILLPSAVRRAKKRQEMIIHIRETGQSYTGVLKQITFCKDWVGGNPMFHVQVQYETPDGTLSLQAAMTTSSHRVPLEGSPVKVLIDEDGNTLIEPDPERPLTFDPNTDEYRQPSGDGGGGS